MNSNRKPLPPPEDFTGSCEDDVRPRRRELMGDGNLGGFVVPPESQFDRFVDGIFTVMFLLIVLVAFLTIALLIIEMFSCASAPAT